MLKLKIKSIIKIIYSVVFKGEYFTYRTFSNSTNKTSNENYHITKRNRDFSILMQGPYIEDNNFTIDTLYMYRSFFPTSKIVYSTTSNLNNDVQEMLSAKEITYIFNDNPPYPGTSNINYQILTTSTAMKYLKEFGANYVLKTRSDQRVNNHLIKDYLFNLIDTFPLKEDSNNQESRLVGCSLNTFKLRPYGMSDMFMFGYIDDMEKYWCIPYETRTNEDVALDKNCSWKDYSLKEICEVKFCASYLRKLDRVLDFSYSDSMSAFADHFIIIDCDALQLTWPKYSLNQNHYKQFGEFPEVSFNDWLLAYANREQINYNESLINTYINQEV